MKKIVFFLIACILLAGCTSTPQVNTVAEAEAIRKLEEQWTAAFKNKDIEKIIRAELSKLIAQQAHMIRRSTEYVAATQRIQELRIIINQHNHDLKYINKLSGSFSTCSAKITNFQTVIFGAVAALPDWWQLQSLLPRRMPNSRTTWPM